MVVQEYFSGDFVIAIFSRDMWGYVRGPCFLSTKFLKGSSGLISKDVLLILRAIFLKNS